MMLSKIFTMFICSFVLQVCVYAQSEESKIARILNDVKQNVSANYDENFSQRFNYVEIERGKASDVQNIIASTGYAVDNNMNGSSSVLTKQFYFDTCMFWGSAISRFAPHLFEYGGTYLTGFSWSYLSRFFLINKLPQIAGKIPPRICPSNSVMKDTLSKNTKVLFEDESSISFIQKYTIKYTLSGAEAIDATESYYFEINKPDYAVTRLFIRQNYLQDGKECSISSFETHKKIGNKYYQDTLIAVVPSVYAERSCGCNSTGNIRQVLLTLAEPVGSNVKVNSLPGMQLYSDPRKYFDDLKIGPAVDTSYLFKVSQKAAVLISKYISNQEMVFKDK